MRSNWLRAFWPKPQEQDFSQILDLCKNKENNIFITEQISENCDQFFQIKKTLFFLPISPISGAKVFPKNRAVMHSFIEVSSTMAKFREIS